MKCKQILIVLLLCWRSCQQITECSQYVQKLINDLLDFKITSIPLPSLMYSGITSNNPGQMKECLSSNYSYFLVFTKNTTSMTQSFTGICVPNQCSAVDIEVALQFLRPRVYDTDDLSVQDNISFVGIIIILSWISVVVFCSLFSYFKQPVVNEYLDKIDVVNESGSGDHPSTQTFSQQKEDQINLFNYYQGYKKIFVVSSKSNSLSLILFLAVVAFSISQQYSYRYNTAENASKATSQLDSYWGVLICNTEISLHTIMFILGFRLAFNFIKMRKFTKIGRLFFQIILKKWLNLIFMSLLIYSFLTICTNQPLIKLWHLNNGKDCPNYIWQIWFLFRNLQLDCKICLPWFTLLEADLLFTILSAPLLLIFRTNKKLGYFLSFLLLVTSILISMQILKNEGIIYQPAKLMNSQKQFWIDYQGNSFVRMAPFFYGFAIGFFLTEATDKSKQKLAFEAKIISLFSKSAIIQWIVSLIGICIMVICFLQIRPYLKENQQDKNPYLYLLLVPLSFVFGLSLFVLPSHLDQPSKLTKIIERTIGSARWIHLERVSLNFYMLFPMVAGYTAFSSQNSINYNIFTITIYLIGDLSITYFLCILATATFENQLIPLVKIFKKKILGKETQYSDIMVEFV